MQFLEGFGRQKKESKIAYSTVEVDTDSSRLEQRTHRQPTTIQGWPVGPQRVGNFPSWIVIDFVLLFLPIAFIVLAAVACSLDGKELSSYGQHVQEAILLGPTIYPLAFAALGGRSLRKIAIWRAGEGTTLGFLEHLLGSQSLVATVANAITLHSLDVLTIMLLVLWALSPLGGQSALRILSETNSTMLSARPVFYSNMDAASELVTKRGEDTRSRLDAVLFSSLMTAESLEWTPVDAWNHPKIPRIEELELAEAGNSTDRSWHTVDPDGKYSYASFTGVNVINLSEEGSTTFSFPYQYMYFKCEFSSGNDIQQQKNTVTGELLPPLPSPGALNRYLNQLNDEGKLLWAFGVEPKDLGNGTMYYDYASSVLKMDGRRHFMYTKGTSQNPEALLYGSRGLALDVWLWECPQKSIMVEVEMTCRTDSCRVQRLRRKEDLRQERSVQNVPRDFVHDANTNKYLIEQLAKLAGNTSIERPNPMDAYVYGTTNPWVIDETTGIIPNNNWTTYVGQPQKAIDLSHRTTRMLNTVVDASRWPLAITRNDPFARRSLNQTSGEPSPFLTLNETQAVVTKEIPIYRVNVPWATCLVICSAVLLLLGIFGFIVSAKTTVPDIFSHVSSLTRDNPHFDTSAGGSVLDGADRARLLRKTRVQLGDIDADSDTGYVAFRSVENNEDCQKGRVRRERMYR